MSPRGGYRKPGGGVRAPGIGKSSQRTDANQPIKVPNVQDSTDLQVGDRQKLEAGQRIQPIGRGPSPTLPAAPPRGSSTPAGGGAVLPEHLFSIPTTRPGEPETEGLPFGPGGGPEMLQTNQIPDDKKLLIDFLARGGNEDAVRLRDGMAQAQRPPDIAPQMSPLAAVEEQPEAAMEEPVEAPMDSLDEPLSGPDDEITTDEL